MRIEWSLILGFSKRKDRGHWICCSHRSRIEGTFVFTSSSIVRCVIDQKSKWGYNIKEWNCIYMNISKWTSACAWEGRRDVERCMWLYSSLSILSSHKCVFCQHFQCYQSTLCTRAKASIEYLGKLDKSCIEVDKRMDWCMYAMPIQFYFYLIFVYSFRLIVNETKYFIGL